MAIFKKTTQKNKKVIAEKSVAVSVREEKKTNKASASARGNTRTLLRPRITEKATNQAEKNAYVFEVDPRSNKKEIAAAVKEFYNITPIAVHTIRIPAKNVFSRGRRGKTAGGKKAVVYVKKGDKIEII